MLKYFFINVLVPLTIGGILYLLFRDQKLLMFKTVEELGLLTKLNQIRVWSNEWRLQIPDWIIFSLPNALWEYSMLSFWRWVWDSNKNVFRLMSIGTVGLCVLIEVFQLMHLIPGTFCWEDILLILISAAIFKIVNQCITFNQIEKSYEAPID